MSLNIKFSKEEFKRVQNRRAQLRRSIQGDNRVFSFEAYKKSGGEVKRLKAAKRQYKSKIQAHV